MFQYDPTTASWGSESDFGDHFHGQNMSEWSAYLGLDSAERIQWDSLLYASEPSRLDSLELHAAGKGPLPAVWSEFGFLGRMDRDRLRKVALYVAYAARVEPFSRGEEDSWSRRGRKLQKSSDPWTLSAEGARLAETRSDPFLRQRWFFQVAKLLFYASPDQALEFIDAHRADLESPSESLRWRTRMYRAGALRHHDTLAANLECARVAVSYPPLAAMAARDFAEPTQDHWIRNLSMAATPAEKAGLWYLVGLRHHDIRAIGKIWALDSSSPLCASLAARRMARLDHAEHDGDDDSLRVLAVRAASSKMVFRPAFWNLLAGHIEGLAHDERAALTHFERALALDSTDTLLGMQVRISRVLARLISAKAPSPDLEAFLVRELPGIDRRPEGSWPRFEPISRREMARIWRADLPLALALSGRISADLDSLRQQLSFHEASGTLFEELAKRRAGFDSNALRSNLGLVLFYHDRFREAADRWALVPDSSRLEADPFRTGITDDLSRDGEVYANSPWTRLDYAREMARLETESRTPGPAGAQAALKLGIGIFNRSRFGNAHRVKWETVFGRIVDSTHRPASAIPWLEQAVEGAANPEDRAEALWVLAKCRRDSLPDVEFRPTALYARMSEEAGTTRYWRRALRECGWLSHWADSASNTDKRSHLR